MAVRDRVALELGVRVLNTTVLVDDGVAVWLLVWVDEVVDVIVAEFDAVPDSVPESVAEADLVPDLDADPMEGRVEKR